MTKYFLYRHFKEAIIINKQRAPLYEKLTNGKSRPISKKLIQMERLGLPYALYIDFKAIKFHKAGIPVIQDEIISMKTIPDFKEKVEVLPLSKFIKSDHKSINKKIRDAYKRQSFIGVSKVTEELIKEYNEYPNFHCLVRHFLESVLRTSNLAMQFKKLAQEKGISSPEKLSFKYIYFHLLGMKRAAKIDLLAASIQAEGIPIIKQDIPHIPPE